MLIPINNDIFSSIKQHDLETFCSSIVGWDINGKNDAGNGILHAAIAYGFDDVAIFFIENGGDLNMQDASGNTALHYCADSKNIRVAELLLNNGAKLNLANAIGDVPLMNAVFESTSEDFSMVALFLRYTCDVDRKNNYGSSPLDFARTIGINDVVNCLEKYVYSDGVVVDRPSVKYLDLTLNDEDLTEWVWDNLIPSSGQASSVQGEILRVIEKLRWESQQNGNINWDDCFVMMVDFLEQQLVEGSSFTQEVKASIQQDLMRLRTFVPLNEIEDDFSVSDLPYIADDLYDRLVEHFVQFCRSNNEVILHTIDSKQFR
ncbi:ankyrin repeat domain-containing protein [Shewanella sp. 5S214]|uniref:ankyrin repeat domain-containing protein n=1 Tax=Shewanella sp. 5S214 TaxID=3229999 RepID=UPI00352E8330